MEHATQFPEEYSKVSSVQKKVGGEPAALQKKRIRREAVGLKLKLVHPGAQLLSCRQLHSHKQSCAES